jgi:hypothetical protein
MRNEKKDVWIGITYPLPESRILPQFVYNLWKKLLCSLGFHLFDEVWSASGQPGHYLSCDACDLMVPIDDSYFNPNDDVVEENWI